MSEEKLLHAEVAHLKELLETKLTNVCNEIVGVKNEVNRLESTIDKHNGRLSTVEKLIEQGKGAKAVISGFWGIIGGAVIAIVVALFNNHFK
jgi:predicted  nucleic acid-binding Zn-ribbon protein